MTEPVASPLTAILERVENGTAVNRALFTSYGFDAGYFERVALGPLEALSARIVVIADATQVDYDRYALRRIGRRYAPGLVHHDGAFHPKVFVLEGDEEVTVGIGSANLTMAGWHSNEELWTIIRSTPENWSQVATDVGAWLQGLTETAQLGSHIARFARDLSKALDRDSADGAGPKLVSNLTRPIGEQLPAGPVAELNLFAPFHDPAASAVRRLFERFEPSTTRIGVQPDKTSLNAQALIELLDGFTGHVELVSLPKDRYRHGKLVEWRTERGWTSLTGSPNLSIAALYRVAGDGNFEIGLISENTDRLLPAGTVGISPESLAEIAIPPGKRPTGERSVEIIEASLEDDKVRLELTGPVSTATPVQAVPVGRPPDAWQPWGEISRGESLGEVSTLAGGSFVRLAHSPTNYSAAVPVLVPAVFRRRLSHLGRSARPPELDELFDDPGLADRFFQQLAAFKDEVRSDHIPSARRGESAPASPDSTHVGWEEYLDRLSGRIGDELLRFALGIPAGSIGAGAGTPVDWDEELADDEIGLEDDDTASAAEDDLSEGRRVPDIHSWSDSARTRLVRVLSALPDAPACAETTHRMLALRMTLTAIAGGAWPKGDDRWTTVIFEHLEALTESAAESEDLRRRLGALVALSLSVLRAHIPRVPPSVESERLGRLGTTFGSLLDELDQEALVVFCEALDARLGAPATPDEALRVAIEVSAGDDIDSAIAALADFGYGIDAERQGDILYLPDPGGDPVDLGLTAVKLLADRPTAVVQVGRSVVFAWTRPRLILLRPMTSGAWRANVYRLSGFGLGFYKDFADLPPSSAAMPGTEQWAALQDELRQVGLDGSALPPLDR